METEKKDKELDLKDMSITLEVDSDVIEKVRKGDITRIILDITEHNQNLILHNINGHLILVTDEMPTTFHGCYLYNGGVFPYAIKDTLDFIYLSDGKDACLTRIIGVETKPGTRFNYQGAGKPIEEDTHGGSCIWEVSFEVVPILDEPRKYLMRWNPSISSFLERDYEECFESMKNGMFRLNWSIFEWEEARRGDLFYMMRVGDEKAGIVFNGQFISDPYPADDWAGSTKRRMYVDMVCTNPVEPGTKPRISFEKLQEEIPAFEWAKGHSGTLLPKDVEDALDDLWNAE